VRRVLFGLPGFGLLVGAVILAPFIVSDYRAYELAKVGVYFIALLGLNMLTGWNGQISLGHGAFMAIGGYTSGILIANHGMKDLWTIPIAGLVAGAAGFLVGVPALRLSGLYLALVTFGIAVSFPQLPKKFTHFSGGSTGLQFFGLPNSTGGVAGVHVFGHHLSANRWFYALTWSIALVLFVAAWALLRGRVGRAWRAIRDSEVAAASNGIGLARYKTAAFAVSAFYAGVAGSLFAILVGFASPDTFPIALSITLVVGLVVGGLESLTGLVVGAAFIQYLGPIAQALLRAADWGTPLNLDPKRPGVPTLVAGALIVLVMILLPTGAGGLVKRLFEPLTSRLYTRS
jgi:branched-chain amino acid transport system permease protein